MTVTTFVAITVMAATFALLYLALVASSARLTGEVWRRHAELADIQRESSRLETEIARLSSIPVLQERSVALGYQPAGTIEYVGVEVGAP